MQLSPKFHIGGFFLCFPSVFIFSVLSSLFWGRKMGEKKTCNTVLQCRQTKLYTIVLFCWWVVDTCLSYSWDSLSNGKHNLDSFRGSGVCIPCLLLSVLISHSYLPFSRDKFLKGVIKYVQYAILLLRLFRRCQDWTHGRLFWQKEIGLYIFVEVCTGQNQLVWFWQRLVRKK